MTRRLLLGAVLALLLAASAVAQTFPMTVKLGIDPDASASAPVGYTVSLDGGAPVDAGLPAVNPSCKTLVGGAVAPCVPFSVSVPTAGSHSVSIVGYNIAGNSAPASITFSAPSGIPSTPSGVKVIK